jgi:hypothetical protein
MALCSCIQKICDSDKSEPTNLEEALQNARRFSKYLIENALDKDYVIMRDDECEDCMLSENDLFEVNSDVSDEFEKTIDQS